MKKKILITSALPYANGPLHFGHIAGAYLPGDCYARFQRLQGHRVLFICGSDEYGVAITLSAEQEGRSPQEHVEIFHKINQSLFDRLNFSFDHYSRTTWEGHQQPTVEFFQDLLANGYIEERETEQLYAEQDRRFLADRYVVGTCPKCSYETARGDECPKCGASYEATDLISPRSKLTGAPLQKKKTRHWFLLFDRFQDRLSKWLEKKNWKPNVMNFAKCYLKDLRARAITRDSDWGISVPLESAKGKVFYVWFDAPIGYISASMDWAQRQGEADLWKDFWLDLETKYVQFIGKDNIPFHGIFFPAMCLGQNTPYKTVDDLSANEFLNLEGRAFSKSEGWTIDLEEFFKTYTADQIRYSLAANAPETSDAEFKWKDFQGHCNADLVGKYGNLVHRTLVFANKQCGGQAPKLESLEDLDEKFLSDIEFISEETRRCYETYSLRKASQKMMELAQLGNVYFDAKKPWLDAKEEATRPRMEATVAHCLHCLKTLALLSFPIIPTASQKLWEQLGFEGELSSLHWDEILDRRLMEGQVLCRPEVLFQKVEDEPIEKEISKLQTLFEV